VAIRRPARGAAESRVAAKARGERAADGGEGRVARGEGRGASVGVEGGR